MRKRTPAGKAVKRTRLALHADPIYELVDGRICRYLAVKRGGREAAARAIEDRSCSLKQ